MVNFNDQKLKEILKSGGIAVVPTDTIYGIVGSALNRDTVDRIYEIRERSPGKAFIILVSSLEDLKKFHVNLGQSQEKVILDIHNKPTSYILDCDRDEFSYLHKGLKSLAFRIPEMKELKSLLREVGPLVAPSANREGLPPAKNIEEAKKYFGKKVDVYVDGGEVSGGASRIVRLDKDGTATIIRE